MEILRVKEWGDIQNTNNKNTKALCYINNRL